MTDNPFTRSIDSELEALLVVVRDPALSAAAERLPTDENERADAIRANMKPDLFPVTKEVDAAIDLRIVPRWFEASVDTAAARFVPGQAEGDARPAKTSICVSLGAPTKGIGVCVSAGR